ncbi:MAG: nitroreductase family deazaflavin-dependent oxidoreductase [Anaerolineae bacterium]
MGVQQRAGRAFRVFLKHFVNPMTRRIAKSKHGPYALVRHVGRRSGTPYETPVRIAPIEGGFVIELTYGFGVDWYQNVIAAGGCTIVWHGHDYPIRHIEPIDAQTGREAFAFPVNWVMHAANMQHFVKVTAGA